VVADATLKLLRCFAMRLVFGLLLVAGCVKLQVVTVSTTTPPEPATEEPQAPDEGVCGAERWDVKLGYDEAAAAVDVANPQAVDIAFLSSQPAPPHIPDRLPRQPPIEATAYRINDVTLMRFIRERDGDYHLVVASAKGDTLIADATVSLVGVGFFDKPHRQTGHAPNAVELHPMVGICFGVGCVPGGR
jgi:hypothetical protein